MTASIETLPCDPTRRIGAFAYFGIGGCADAARHVSVIEEKDFLFNHIAANDLQEGLYQG
jgi:hypothetical protein